MMASRSRRPGWAARTIAFLAAGVCSIAGITGGCTLFQSEQVAKGQHLYAHYCMHCHGENGRQNEGYNWSSMPDPRPKDLANKGEMSTFSDEEIFHTIYRDMKDTTPEVGDKIGDEEFAVPTMPTFKYTLSEEEIWSIVAYVRTLHGMSLTYNLEGRRKELEAHVQEAEEKHTQAKQVLEAAETKAEADAEAKGTDVDEEATAKEEEALAAATNALEQAKAALANFTARPKYTSVARPSLETNPQATAKLADRGKQLYTNKYGCNACHRVGDAGGLVGPPLDRAGFRLNATWVYRWVKNPQSFKPETRMPNLGLSDEDAKAVTIYVSTLRAPRPDESQPIQKASSN